MAVVLVSNAALVWGVGIGKEPKSLRRRATLALSSRNASKVGLLPATSGSEKASKATFQDLSESVSAPTNVQAEDLGACNLHQSTTLIQTPIQRWKVASFDSRYWRHRHHGATASRRPRTRRSCQGSCRVGFTEIRTRPITIQ